MSRISDAMSRANACIATARGEALSYRQDDTRAWTALTGFVLDRDDVILPTYDDGESAEATVRTGRLSGPLTPVLEVGYQLLDANGDTWAVVTAELDQQQLCAVRLTTIDNAGPDRGGAA